jgi:hypothetical protein
MKPLMTSVFIALTCFLGALREGRAAAAVNVDFFYTALEPYGEWVDVEDYGYCWHPNGVDADWRPYTVGHWAYTDAGWTWISDEPFGWVTFHYGRWADLDDVGWVWVPDAEWAPAWVSFRNSEEYVGWAPLPPEARFQANIGFSRWVDAYFDIGPMFYSFVPIQSFSAPVIRQVIVQPTESITIFRNTTNVTNITQRRNVVFIGGPQFERVSAKVERPIPRLKLERQTAVDASAAAQGKAAARVEGDRLVIPAPQVNATAAVTPPKAIARKIPGGKVDHGWKKVADTAAANELRAKIKREEKVPAGLPATPKFARAKGEQPEAVGEKRREPNAPATSEAKPGKGPAETPELPRKQTAPQATPATPQVAPGKRSTEKPEEPRKQAVPPAPPTEATPPAPKPGTAAIPERPKASQSESAPPVAPGNPPRPQAPAVPERERAKQPQQPRPATPEPPPLPQPEKPQTQPAPERQPPPVGERLPVAPRREVPPALPNVERPAAPQPPAAPPPQATERRPNPPAADQPPAPDKRKKPGTGAEANR